MYLSYYEFARGLQEERLRRAEDRRKVKWAAARFASLPSRSAPPAVRPPRREPVEELRAS